MWPQEQSGIIAESEERLTSPGEFLIGGGIMGELIRSKDWGATPLGPIGSWPQSLRTTVSLCLASNFPINLIWGPEHIQIYNDGYRPICAGKHPRSLGENYTKTWASAWEILDEAFQRALAGHTSFLENQRMFLDRNGYLEETFFTFTLSPIRDESGAIGGLFHPVTETTAQILSQRRTRALQDLASRASHSKTIEEACSLAAEAIGEFQLDFPFALIYLTDENGRTARLCAQAHIEPGTAVSPESIDLFAGSDSPWPLRQVRSAVAVPAVQVEIARFASVIRCGPYPKPPKAAFVLPVLLAGLEHAAGFVVMAVSPRLPLTEEYKGFVELIGAGLTSAFMNARAYQDERKRAEKLAELDRAKTAFFSNVSHEFRTPLTLMLGPLEELLGHPGEQITAQREVVDLVHRNGVRLLRVVNTLLDFSRTEANRAQAAYEPVDLAALTRDLASLFRSAIEKGGLTLAVDCPDISEPVYVDPEMWEKIVLNLLSNAFKFTFCGVITVSLRESADEVTLSVRDTGTGIPAKKLSNVFKRFHRIQGAQGRTFEGTGIGLALVDDLVRLHGGKVRAESEQGVGTVFDVVLPKGFKHLPAEHVRRATKVERSNRTAITFAEEVMRWLPDSGEGSGTPRRRASNAARNRILLADDNADMGQYIQNILHAEFEVEAVEDGAAALAAIRTGRPDLVLTDVMMPRLDGFGLLKEIRMDNDIRAIPVIMLSARAGDEARVEGIQAGADEQMQEVIRTRRPVRDEASLKNSEGAIRHYDYVFVPVLTPSGLVEVVAGSTRDITELRETNLALGKANEDLQQFAYSASHDLQEPLRMVAVYSQLLQKKYGKRLDAQADIVIKHCVDGAVRMEQLIKDLLLYTSASTTRNAVPAYRTSLEEVFKTTVDSLQAAILETNATITRSSLPEVNVDAVHLRQIFAELTW